MKKHNYLILVDVDGFDDVLPSFWAESRFWEKIRQLNIPTIVWISGMVNYSFDQKIMGKRAELLDFIEKYSMDAMIYIEGSQLFFDPEMLLNSLKKYEKNIVDYFTQYEHCRLPVGIGARILSITKMASFEAASPREYIDYVLTHPDNFSFFYDDEQYASFKESQFDSRYSDSLRNFLMGIKIKHSWNCNGFRKLYQNYGSKIPEIAKAKNGFRIDEKKLKSPYGFESIACSEFPTYIMFDLCNVCNSKCVHCPHSTVGSKKGEKNTFLEFNFFKKVIDECRDHKISFIRLTGDGEPLLHKDILKMISYATQKGVGPLCLTTNGSLLTPEKSEALLDSGLFMVDFSIDAASEKTFSRIRKGLDYDAVISNILNFIDLNEQKKHPLKIMVSFVKQKLNQNEVKEFEEYWRPKSDKVLIRELVSYVNMVQKDDNSTVNFNRWPCPHFFRRIIVNYDGKLKACPVDWTNGTSFAEVGKTTIFDAWHGNFYLANRMEHLNGKIKPSRLCHNCNDWVNSPWDLGYEKVVAGLKEEVL